MLYCSNAVLIMMLPSLCFTAEIMISPWCCHLRASLQRSCSHLVGRREVCISYGLVCLWWSKSWFFFSFTLSDHSTFSYQFEDSPTSLNGPPYCFELPSTPLLSPVLWIFGSVDLWTNPLISAEELLSSGKLSLISLTFLCIIKVLLDDSLLAVFLCGDIIFSFINNSFNGVPWEVPFMGSLLKLQPGPYLSASLSLTCVQSSLVFMMCLGTST